MIAFMFVYNPPVHVALAVPATFSALILLLLTAILAVSGTVFRVLTRQWTADRPMQALREWARDRKFTLEIADDAELPESLDNLRPLNPVVEITLASKSTTLVRVSTATQEASPRAMWHLLIRKTEQARNPAGLRPAQAVASFLDLFSMNGFPSLLPPERFVVFAIDSKDARAIAASPARGLLPADIGLLVHGPYLTLDFSTRPFDAIEFERMLIIMDQVIAHSV